VLALAATALPWAEDALAAVAAPLPAQVLDRAPLAGAVVLTTWMTHALAVRSGGRPLLAGALALLLAGAAAVTRHDVLLAGAAVATAVVAAILAVLATKPAARFLGVVREVLVAAVVAAVGAFATAAYEPQVSVERTEYLAIALSLVATLALVYRLGAGLHGLGRRGWVMILIGVVLLTVTLAYTEALSRWGPPGTSSAVQSALEAVRGVTLALPRPIVVLLGVPALAWGVSTRARRRQGWWVSAFAAPGFAVVATSLLAPGQDPLRAGLALGYAVVLGLVVGYGLVRADLYLTGARGRRARRLEELAAHRPEPGRLGPLL
jgi:hypothetical protein